jgi:hypothetical protein
MARASQLRKEKVAGFNTTLLTRLPSDNAHPQEIRLWMLACLSFDFSRSAAEAWMMIPAASVEWADAFCEALEVIERTTVECGQTAAKSVWQDEVKVEAFLSELRIQLALSRESWKEGAFRFTRESAEKRELQARGGVESGDAQVASAEAAHAARISPPQRSAASQASDGRKSGTGRPRQERQKDAQLQQLKLRVRKLRKEGLTHREICGRLGNSLRPPRASWRDMDWPLAYKRHTSAVTKWLSEACG